MKLWRFPIVLAQRPGTRWLAMPLALAMAAMVEGAELLRWRYEPGEQWQTVFQQTTDQETIVGQRTIAMSGTQRMVVLTSVVAPEAEQGLRLEHVIQRLQLTLNLGDVGKIDFDSSVEKDPAGLTTAVAGALRAVVGVKLTQPVLPDGQLGDVAIPEATREAIDANPLARRLFFQSMLSELTHQAMLKLPEEEIEPGHEWTMAGQVTTELGSTPVDTVLRYRSRTAREAAALDIIDVRIEIGAFPAELVKQLPMKLVEQSGEGTIWFDNALGRIASAHFDLQQAVEIGMNEQRVVQKLRKVVDVNVTPPPPESPPAEAGASLSPAATPVD